MKTHPHLRFLGAASLFAALVIAAPAGAEPSEQGWPTLADLDLPVPTPSEQQESIRAYEHHPAKKYTYERAVVSIETVETDGADTVISLSADILFAPDQWDLPDSVPERLKELLSEVPDGAGVAVAGHTDSVTGAVDNQELSENRAGAVAAVIEDVRADLMLEVEGFGASDLKQSESGAGVDAAREANRRVELRYQE